MNPRGVSNPRGNACLVGAVCGLLVLAVGLVFGQTARHAFISLDDPECVYLNRNVSGGLTPAGVKWAFTHWCDGTFTPASLVSHMLDCQLYGLDAGGHHLTNALLHAATVVLLFLVLLRMTGRKWASALVAALFAIHPLRVESVAWVVERKDVLSGLFFVLALAAYVRLVRRGFSLARYLIVVVCFSLGLLAKPMLVTLPLVLLLLDYWPLGRFSPASAGRLVREKLPLLALSVVFCVMAVSSPSGSQQGDPHDRRFDAAWRAKNVPLAYASYLGSFVYPVGLELPYPRSGPELPLGKVLAAALVPLLLTSAALILWRRRPYFAVGWLWYLVMLAPVSGLLQFDMHATTMTGDRFTYLPQIGLGIALSWGLADALRWATARRWLCAAAAALVVAVLMGAAWRQTSFWRDDETLWKHSLACTARNPMALHALGVALLDRGQVFQAIEQFRAALTVDPDQPSTLSHYYLGVALAGVGRLDEAIGEYQQAVRFQPYDAAAHNNLGQALLIRGRIAEGLALCQEALRLEPELAEAHYNVGNVFYVRGRVDEAIAEYQKAVKAKPGYAPAHYHLGLALAQRGKLDEAIAEYRQALTVDPAVDPEANPDFSAAEVHNALGRALAARGRTAEAAGHFRAALALRPDFAEAQRNLDRATSSQ